MMARAQSTAARLRSPAEETGPLSTRESAQWAGVSTFTIYRWIAEGRLPAAMVGHQYDIRVTDLAAAQALAHAGGIVPEWRRDRQRVGMRLRTLREAAGWTQIELAQASGLTHEAISRLEIGRAAPYAETVRRLARALHIEPERFVSHDQVGLTMLTVAETAARLGVPIGRVRRWLREGMLEGSRVSGEWRVPAIAVMELGRSGRLRGRSARLDPRYRG